MPPRPFPRTTFFRLLLSLLPITLWLLCAGSAPTAARSARPGTSAQVTPETLRPYLGVRVRLELRSGFEVLAHLRAVRRLHVRVEGSDGRYVSIALQDIRRVSRADAPRPSPLDPRVRQWLATRPRVPGKRARNIGIGMTLGGLALNLIPAALSSGDSDSKALRGAVIGSAVVLLTGVTTWVVGEVYMKTHQSHPGAERNRKLYRALGIGLTLGGTAIFGLGVGIGYAAARAESPTGLVIGTLAGGSIAVLGAITTLLVGLPMWITAAAAQGRPAGAPPRPRTRPHPVAPVTTVTDPHHDQTSQLRLTDAQPRAHIFSLSARF
jgi:hypothetical protein